MHQSKKISLLVLVLLLCTGCASIEFRAVEPEPVRLGDLQILANDSLWNLAPGVQTTFLHGNSKIWTRDGLLLDRLMLISDISNGGTLFNSESPELVYPIFRSDMLPNEIAELTEASLTKLFGTGAVVQTSGLKPYRLQGQRAVSFDLRIESTEAPAHRGRAVAFIAEDKLYEMIFIATDIYYFDKHDAAAEMVMSSARLFDPKGG